MQQYRKVCVVGLGYIGLPTAAALAARRIQVVGADINKSTVETVNQGRVHIIEPELDMLVHAAVTEGYLRASTLPERADAFIIAVPTPFKDGHEPDLSYVEAATASIAPLLEPNNLVILESTSPVGTTELVAMWLSRARRDLTFPQEKGEVSDICIAHCPERVLPGHIVRELVENDRIIGGMTKRCAEAASALYKTFVQGRCFTTNLRAAEMCKLVENAYRDVNIAFANELSLICDRLGIDVWELIRLANHHPRVNILQPGPGVGGHCIAVDPWFIVHGSREQSRLIRTAREVNDGKPEWVIEKVRAALRNGAGALSDCIGCLGLTYKADIDDLRESPSLHIALRLGELFPGQVLAVEPNIKELPAAARDVIRLATLDETFASCRVLVLLVDHRQFRNLPRSVLNSKTLVDTKGLWESGPNDPSA